MKRRLSLTNVKVGAIARAASARVEITRSEPPAAYNDATLLDDMLNAGRHAESAADEAVLVATNGIGTARTRSESIQDLVKNGALARVARPGTKSGSTLVLSDAGRRLVNALPPELRSVGLTAKWEILLRKVERGEISRELFRERNDMFVSLVVKEAQRQKQKQQSATTPTTVAQNQNTV